MQTYRDKIVFQATGHDHIMSIRYSKVDEQDPSSANFLNKVLFPAVSPTTKTNPGFSTFDYNTETGEAENLKSTYIQLSKTYGLPETKSYTELPFFDVDFSTTYGLKDLSADSIEALVNSLKSDKSKAREYIFNTIGVDAKDDEQLAYGVQPFRDYGYLKEFATIKEAFTDTVSLHKEFCVMSKA